MSKETISVISGRFRVAVVTILHTWKEDDPKQYGNGLFSGEMEDAFRAANKSWHAAYISSETRQNAGTHPGLFFVAGNVETPAVVDEDIRARHCCKKNSFKEMREVRSCFRQKTKTSDSEWFLHLQRN